ncbi:MAG: tRNA A-37 threonylcarbamoyl transferase component Bud32 [Gammaproteobacteria bacterium]|jgi:tRNA A-37 threonylcarbamoyl transferase component Bud32
MRIIIINDAKEYSTSLRHLFADYDPQVEVTEHDPEVLGMPDSGFDWNLYDLLVIGDQLGGTESGLAWLAVFSLDVKLPPTLMLAAEHDLFVASKLAEMPATAYVIKSEFDAKTLPGILTGLGVTERRGTKFDPLDGSRYKQDRQIFGDLSNREGNVENGYKFVRLIGQGAHSRVYLAERLEDRLTLVLKIMDLESIDDDSVSQRFAHEAAILADINSPYVVKFYGHDFTPKYGYIAVEFFTRGDLKHRIENGVTTENALLYALNIAYGLEAIHMRNIVHRDLKPGNIMFRSDDSLALADFGISKHLGGSWDLTKTGSILGTLNYLSPEQGLGKVVDQRTDLYGLGMILFEMLTGEKAFHASSPGALVYQHLYADVPTLPAHLSQYQAIVDNLLAKDPADRYASATELAAKLLPFCEGL